MSKKVLIIIIGIFLVSLSLTWLGFWILWNKVNPVDPQRERNPKQKAEAGHALAIMGPIFSLDTFIVNLKDEEGKRYLRITMALEVSDGTTQAEVEKRLPQVRHRILMTLPSKKYDDIRSGEGKIRLRDEIITKLNSLLTTGKVTDIYFTEFVVQ